MFAPKPKDSERSKQWPKVRKAYLKKHPVCAVCGTKKSLNVHHVEVFHLNPEKELLESNLITLCEGMDKDCHRLFGHLGNYRSWNEKVREDAKEWSERIQHRPKG